MFLTLLLIPFAQSVYVLNTKQIVIRSGYFHLIHLNSTYTSEKTQIQHNGSITTDKSFYDSAMYDVFLLDEYGLNCYLSIYYNSSWEQKCLFIYNSSQTFLKQTNFTYNYDIDSSDDLYMIIDNTYFPLQGAYFSDNLYLHLEYQQSVQPIPTYYQWTIKIGIVFIGIFICFLIWCIVLSIKYKNELKLKEQITQQRLLDPIMQAPLKKKKNKNL